MGSPLLTEALWWRDAWRWAFSGGKASVAIREDWLGYITATELTHGESGWHYHRHLLHFYSAGSGEIGSELMRRRWLDAIKRHGRWNDHAARYAFDSVPVNGEAAARYCAKIGAELAATTTKASRTPLRILRDAAVAGEPAPLWLEALVVCTTLKIGSVRWSQGLRKTLALADELPDEVVAAETEQEGDELLGVLTRSQWLRVVRARLEYRLLQAAQLGAEAVNQILQAASAGPLVTVQELASIQSENNK
jgi:hypothetical protein